MKPAEPATPLRTDAARLQFCDEYFSAVGTPIVYSSDAYREYELPRDVDKELTDRPFYWMWVEKTGQSVPPTTIRLAFSQEAVGRENERLREEALLRAERQYMTDMERRFLRPPTAEFVTLGSFRLNKIYDSVDKRGRFACVRVNSTSTQPLIPWLLVNALVSLRCDLVEQEYASYGVCLVNGQVVESFHDKIAQVNMVPAMASEVMAKSKLSLQDGFDAIYKHAERRIRMKPTDWAMSALSRLSQDIKQLNTYYDSLLPSLRNEERTLAEMERKRKINELREKSEPRMEITLKQAALVGLPER